MGASQDGPISDESIVGLGNDQGLIRSRHHTHEPISLQVDLAIQREVEREEGGRVAFASMPEPHRVWRDRSPRSGL